jgi:hypothetical protein
MASGEVLTVSNEVLAELTLERGTLGNWVSIAKITIEIVLGLHVQRAYDAAVDLKHSVLGPGEDGSLYRPGHDHD